MHETVLEINLDAIVHNLNYFPVETEAGCEDHGHGQGILLWKR